MGTGGATARAKARSYVDISQQGRKGSWEANEPPGTAGWRKQKLEGPWRNSGGQGSWMDIVLFKASPDLEPEGGRFPGLGEGVVWK